MLRSSMFSLPRVKLFCVLAVLVLASDGRLLPAADALSTPLGTRRTNTVDSAASISTNQPNVVATNTLDDKLRLGIGDRLSYRIVEDLEDAKPLVVTDSGDIEVPLIGRVPALEKTCKQLAAEIKAKLEEDYYYTATVILAVDVFNRSRGKVYLVGYVRAPGPQDKPCP